MAVVLWTSVDISDSSLLVAHHTDSTNEAATRRVSKIFHLTQDKRSQQQGRTKYASSLFIFPTAQPNPLDASFSAS